MIEVKALKVSVTPNENGLGAKGHEVLWKFDLISADVGRYLNLCDPIKNQALGEIRGYLIDEKLHRTIFLPTSNCWDKGLRWLADAAVSVTLNQAPRDIISLSFGTKRVVPLWMTAGQDSLVIALLSNTGFTSKLKNPALHPFTAPLPQAGLASA